MMKYNDVFIVLKYKKNGYQVFRIRKTHQAAHESYRSFYLY